MVYGPFPPPFIERLREILNANGVDPKIFSSDEEKERVRRENSAAPVSEIPVYSGPQNLLYIEIENKDLMPVKAELVRMGVLFGESDFDPEFNRSENICPICDHVQDHPGLCPKHRVPLLTFEQLVALKVKRRERFERWFLYFAGATILALAAIVLYGYLKDSF